MSLTLSARLMACCQLIQPGQRVADIGCDHGYLGIYLLTHGIARSVIAADVNEGPLQSAVLNARHYGVAENISFYLSDGLRNIPRDFDVLVCAGMGADTIVSILQAAPWLKRGAYRMVLQCQSKTPFLRKYLGENEWRICRELVVRDGRFLYTVMEVERGASPLTPAQWYFPPALSCQDSELVREYLLRVIRGLELSVTGKKENADPLECSILEELKALEVSL